MAQGCQWLSFGSAHWKGKGHLLILDLGLDLEMTTLASPEQTGLLRCGLLQV